MKKRAKQHDNCTILRRLTTRSATMSLEGKRIRWGPKRTEEGPCGVPLFSDVERGTGICRSCRDGWESKNNTFASTEERLRATVGLCL